MGAWGQCCANTECFSNCTCNVLLKWPNWDRWMGNGLPVISSTWLGNPVIGKPLSLCWKILFTVAWLAVSVYFHGYQHQGKCGCCGSCSPEKGALFSQLWCCLAGWCMQEFLKTVLFCTEIICVHNSHGPNFSLCSCFASDSVLLSSMWFYLIFLQVGLD